MLSNISTACQVLSAGIPAFFRPVAGSRFHMHMQQTMGIQVYGDNKRLLSVDAGPTLAQRLVNVSYLLGIALRPCSIRTDHTKG